MVIWPTQGPYPHDHESGCGRHGLPGRVRGGAGLPGRVRAVRACRGGCGHPGRAGLAGMAQVPQPAWVPPMRSAMILSPYPDRW